MPEDGTTNEQATGSEHPTEATGEEIGLLASTVAVTQSAASGEIRQRRLRSVPTALWPDIPGIFFPEPYVIDFTWKQGVPEAAVRARNTAGDAYRAEPIKRASAAPPVPSEGPAEGDDEKTFIDLEPEDLEPLEEDVEYEPEDLEKTIPDLELLDEYEETLTDLDEGVSASGPDSIQPLDDADLEEIVEARQSERNRDTVKTEAVTAPQRPSAAEPSPAGPVIIKGGSAAAPPVPADASSAPSSTQELTRPIRVVRRPEGAEDVEDARVRPLVRIRPLRRVQGPRPTRAQPNLIESALGADPKTTGQGRPEQGRPWYEVIFDDSYFVTLPKGLHRQTRKEAKFVHEWLRLEDKAELLDVACGFGRHAIELAKRGFRVTGLDLSSKLIDKARAEAERRKMTIEFQVGDMREIAFETRFDGATMLGYSFGFFDDQTNFEVLRRVRQALKPKGRFLLQLLNRDRLTLELPEVIWWRGQDCLILEEIELDPETSRMSSKRTLVFDDGRSPWEQYIEIRLYSLHEIYTLLEDAGFRVADIAGSLHYPGLFFPTQSRELFVLAERERDYV